TMVGLAFFYRSAVAGRDYTTVTGKDYSTAPIRLGPFRYLAVGVCSLWMVLALLAPITFLVLASFMRRYGFFHIPDPFTGRNWERMVGRPCWDLPPLCGGDSIFWSSAWNSIIIAVCVGLGSMVLYTLVAYFIIRSKAATTGLVDALSWLP